MRSFIHSVLSCLKREISHINKPLADKSIAEVVDVALQEPYFRASESKFPDDLEVEWLPSVKVEGSQFNEKLKSKM